MRRHVRAARVLQRSYRRHLANRPVMAPPAALDHHIIDIPNDIHGDQDDSSSPSFINQMLTMVGRWAHGLGDLTRRLVGRLGGMVSGLTSWWRHRGLNHEEEHGGGHGQQGGGGDDNNDDNVLALEEGLLNPAPPLTAGHMV